MAAPSAAASPSAATPAQTTAAGELSESARQMLAWLPEDNVVPGWTRSKQPRQFGPANLWEYIDGAAESYLGFDFEELVTLDYTNASNGLRVTVDLYRMAAPLSAFGIYAQETNPAAEFLDIGAEGHLSGTALTLWTGSCYVKLTSGTKHADLPAALRALGAEIGRRIGGDTKRPAQFDRFPTAGLVAHSFKVVPKDVLGQNYLTGAFEAQYGSGDAAWKLTLIPFEGTAQATSAFARYREFVTSNGEIVRGLKAPGDGGFVGKDGFYGLIVAVRAGSSIAVALGPPSEQVGGDMVTRLLR